MFVKMGAWSPKHQNISKLKWLKHVKVAPLRDMKERGCWSPLEGLQKAGSPREETLLSLHIAKVFWGAEAGEALGGWGTSRGGQQEPTLHRDSENPKGKPAWGNIVGSAKH